MAESVSSQSLVLGRYQLTDRVGTGSSGSVFAATDSQTGSEVVVKFFDGAEDGFPSWTSELRLVMRFKHPNIVPCLDAGFDEVHQLWALVFARAHGGSLRRALIAGTLRKEQHAQVLLNVASALVYAHSQGVIHRDVKPDKITPVEKWLSFFRRPSEKVAEVFVTHWLWSKHPKRRSKQDHQTWISG